MHDDADFLAAVAANPSDQLTRLVYADWLDERNDPRGELIRIEEEVRFEPAWSEVLWSQKPRRNELRAACDPAWLAAMRYGTDCLPLFYGRPFPDHWRDGWRLIREATERWLGVPMPDVGGHAEEVAAVEKRLGLTLPPSVREFVAFLIDVPNQGPWMGSRVIDDTEYRLEFLPTHDILEIGSGLGDEVRYGIALGQLSDLANPSVIEFAYTTGQFGEGPLAFRSLDSLHQMVSKVFFDVFQWICRNSARRMELAHDWGVCRAWLADEFSYHTHHAGGDIFEDENQFALLYMHGCVGLWSQADSGGYLLPEHIRYAQAEAAEHEDYTF